MAKAPIKFQKSQRTMFCKSGHFDGNKCPKKRLNSTCEKCNKK